jgi:hypothetical protein
MQYQQIVLLLFVAMLAYYAVMIVLDIQRAKATALAEQNKDNEEEIDISDEAQNFHTAHVSRENPDGSMQVKRVDSTKQDAHSPKEEDVKHDAPDNEKKKSFRREGYREAIMTDGVPVERILEEVNQLAETGTSDLGAVIVSCENAK